VDHSSINNNLHHKIESGCQHHICWHITWERGRESVDTTLSTTTSTIEPDLGANIIFVDI
jgi:hypothetical protein